MTSGSAEERSRPVRAPPTSTHPQGPPKSLAVHCPSGPVITALEIENFKAIGPRQRIELAPITLLFGPNSAGKSTILHALLYLHTVLKTGDPDVDQVELGGETLRLGGFQRLIHGRDMSRSMRLRVEFEGLGRLNLFERDITGSGLEDLNLEDLNNKVTGAWIEIEVAAEEQQGRRLQPRVVHAWFGIAGEAIPLVLLGPTGPEGPTGVMINTGHPLLWERDAGDHTSLGDFIAEFAWRSEESRSGEPCWMLGSKGFIQNHEVLPPEALDSAQRYFLAQWRGHWLPAGSSPGVVLTLRGSAAASVVPSRSRPMSTRQTDGASYLQKTMGPTIEAFLEMVMLGPASHLVDLLEDAVHLGPLRTIPEPGFLYRRTGRRSPWSTGLAAWDLLIEGGRGTSSPRPTQSSAKDDRARMIPGRGGELIELVNNWLTRLGAGYTISVVPLHDGDQQEVTSRLIFEASDGTDRLPVELGAGVSQLVPVLVALLEGSYRLSLIEQPELHVHPALQVGLGDLLIAASKGWRGRDHLGSIAMVETHSEHLLLRLLRRVEETTAGTLEEKVLALAPEDLSVLYIEPSEQGSMVRRLRVDEDGDFRDQWPRGFFDERTQELLG